MKSQIDTGTYCGGYGCEDNYEAFDTANALYQTFLQNGQNGLNVYSLYGYVEQLQKLFTCSGILNRTHTNAALTAYNWGAATVNLTQHAPVSFKVGSGKNFAPNDGDTIYANIDLKGYLPKLIYCASIADFLDADSWTPRADGGFILSGRTFITDESYTMIFSEGVGDSGNPFTDAEVLKLKALLSVDNP
jgi:hypothetical protein